MDAGMRLVPDSGIAVINDISRSANASAASNVTAAVAATLVNTFILFSLLVT